MRLKASGSTRSVRETFTKDYRMNEITAGGVYDDTHTDYHAAKAMAEARMQRGVWKDRFAERFGYPLARAVPALYFDVGPRTPKYRTDFYDMYLECCEEAYWKKVFDWTQQRGLLTAYDNLGREIFAKQPLAYIDYFRTQV